MVLLSFDTEEFDVPREHGVNFTFEQDKELVAIRERLRKSAELSYSQGEITVDIMLSKIDEEYQARMNAQIHEIESLRELYRLKEEN